MRENVLFDLDQTVVPWDTQLVFRSYVLRQEPVRRLGCLVFPFFLPFAKLLQAAGLKRVFHCYLWGMKRERLEELAQNFVDEWLPELTYPEVIAEIEAHKAAGRQVILSSASPDLWVNKIGEALGFHQSLGTRFDWGETVEFFPDMIGENHKSEEKVRRLSELNIHDGVAGYSDSRADVPMLLLCDEKILINPLPGIRREGEQRGWRLMEPDKPWKDRRAFGIACTLQYFGLWKP